MDLENFIQLEQLIKNKNITINNCNNNLYQELKYSIVPEWNILNFYNKYNNQFDDLYQTDKLTKFNLSKPDFYNFNDYISEGINNTNKINGFDSEVIFESQKIDMLKKLYDYGIEFDMRFDNDYKLKIKSNEVLFPICCVGKNRSQFMFYYLKKIKDINNKNFLVGYPSSGDELSVLIESEESNKNILSSFFPQYKKDNFSNIISKSFNISNPDGIEQIPRSIHVFDKILKIKEEYNSGELKNFESNKYKLHKYDIFESNNLDYLKIKTLFEKYFLDPSNLLDLLNYDLDKKIKIDKITYICMSDKSFYNLCRCLYHIKSKYPELKLNSIRIVYFAINDIFQKSNIKQIDIENFKQKIDSGLIFE